MLGTKLLASISLILLATACGNGKNKMSSKETQLSASSTSASDGETIPYCSTEGQVSCIATKEMPAVDIIKLATQLAPGESAGGITNSSAGSAYSACTPTLLSNCIADGITFKAALSASLNPDNIRSGASVGGLSGSLISTAPACTADAQAGCLATAEFPAIKKSSSLQASAFSKDLALAGVVGSVESCASDGQLGCITRAEFPAIDKSLTLEAQKSKFSTALTIAGVQGSLIDCGSDGASSCLVKSPTYAAALIAGADVKITNGQRFAGIDGLAPVVPAACSSDGASGCISSAQFPAVDKTAIQATAMRNNLSLAGVTGTILNCNADAGTGCYADGTLFKAGAVAGAGAKIMSPHTLAGVLGAVFGKPADCSTDGEASCVTTADFPAVNKNLKITTQTSKFRSSATLLGSAGDLTACASDGDSECVVEDLNHAALALTGAAAKIENNLVLGGVTGTAAVKPAACQNDGEDSCVASVTFPAVNKAVTLTANAAKFSDTLTIAGVQGSIANCGSNGSQDCLAAGSYKAALACGANGSNCFLPTYSAVSQKSKAIDFTTITAGIIKKSTSIAGVTGDFPSSTYPLAVADGVADLTTANFLAKIKADTDFGWFDRLGNRYTHGGNDDITETYIRDNVVLFGVGGTLVAYSPCASDNAEDCVSTARYKSVDTQGFTTWDVRGGKSAAGIAGSWVLNNNYNNPTRYDKTSAPNVAGADALDTIDDSNSSGGGQGNLVYVFNNSTLVYQGFGLDSTFDIGGGTGGVAGDGLCNGNEICIFLDKVTNMQWTKASASKYSFENSILYCEGLTLGPHSDWRLPTTKELAQVYIDGIAFRSGASGVGTLGTTSFSSSTTDSTDVDQFWTMNLTEGIQTSRDKTLTYNAFCVRGE